MNSSQNQYLKKIQSKIHDNTSKLNKESDDYGICVGDINATNFHINEKNVITHFDFDQCGYSVRTFEIGKFAPLLNSHNTKNEIMHTFIEGYEKIRKRSNSEKMCIFYFEIASIIWVMSIHVHNIDKIGYHYLEYFF